MKSFILSFSVFLLGLSTACQKQDEIFVIPDMDNPTEVVQTSIQRSTAEKMSRMFYKSLAQNKGLTRTDMSNLLMEQVQTDNGQILWIANFPNDKGYIVLTTDHRAYPILTFNTEGEFHYDRLSAQEKAEFNRLVENYECALETLPEDEPSIWDELAEGITEESDTTTVVDIEFFADKILATDSAAIDNQNASVATRGGGSISRRTYQKNYPTIYPLLGRKNRQWTKFIPYCYDMPNSYFGGVLTEGGGTGPAWLSDFTICFALALDHLNLPNSTFWSSIPNVQTERTSTPLTRFLKQLHYELGGTCSFTSGTEILWSHTSSTIPTIMNNYGLVKSVCERYYPDQAGFDGLKSHLNTYNPIIFFANRNSQIESSIILDGVAELKTKVTTKKYFLGIKYKTIVKYYYMDYFHNVSPIAHSNDKWVLYDAINTGNNYFYKLKRK
ncbi:MAG: Spi family protease inhibitor [Alistipes sp.]|nr:Spi family protease inhibitor [Alistipes sp.]